MKIAAVTMVYNEALILPYFLRHYRYLDEIHVLYEKDSTDETLEILNHAPNVIIKNCHIAEGLDDIEKVNLINDTLHDIEADWVYVVDSDEFIFPLNTSPNDFLKRQKYDVVAADMFTVYRNRTDRDLDPSLPPVPQRIHGRQSLVTILEEPYHVFLGGHIKPIVVRPSSRIRFQPGNHSVDGNIEISPESYSGVHWQMADPIIAIKRKIQCRDRMSERNKELGFGWHNWNVTEKWIMAECERHLDDPIIYALRSISEVCLP